MSIDDFNKQVSDLNKFDKIPHLKDLVTYLHNAGYSFSYYDETIIVTFKIIHDWDIQRLNHIIQIYGISLTGISTFTDNSIKFYLEKKI